MIGSGLKKFAQQHGMKIARGVAYGSFYGYAATFCEGSGWKRIVVSTRFPDPAKRDALRTALAQQNLTTQYRVKSLEIFDDGIVILFLDNPGTMKKIEAFSHSWQPMRQLGQTSAANAVPLSWTMVAGSCSMKLHSTCIDPVPKI